MRSTTRQLVAWAALAVGAPAAFGQLATTLDAGGGLYATQIGGRALLREPSGRIGELELPAGTALRRLDALAGGWLVSGEVSEASYTELLLLRGQAGTTTPLPAPPSSGDQPLRAGPAPFIDGGRLAGLAWLEGVEVRQTAVWAASWTGSGWQPPELVSPVGPGTQIALAGTVLADGSWLLVWAAYDGNDDEIRWSRRVDGAWSEPSLLHPPNDFPDIRPSLVATRRGALAAWNGYDGETYRVRLAVFEGEGWRELDFPSPPGAVRPGLTPDDAGARLLYRTVVPSTWTLHDLDEGGSVTGTAVLGDNTLLRPALVPREGSGPSLEWIGGRSAVPLPVDAWWLAVP